MGTSVSSGWLQGSLIAPECRADGLIREDIDAIETSAVTAADGGIAAVFENGTVRQLGGRGLFEETTLSTAEWTDFLTKTSDPAGKWVYSVAYNEQENFWLVVGFPVSIRIRLSFATNTESAEYTKALFLYITSALVVSLLLFTSAYVYAKISAKAFINPLRRLCAVVKRMTRGEYDSDESFETENKDVSSGYKMTGEFLWLNNDIYKLSSELKNGKILRENLEKGKKQMLLDISHDLRNPLATIMGYAEMLITDQPMDEEKCIRYTQIIYKNSVRASSLMNDLFTYTKLERTGFQPTLSQGDICEFLREQALLFLPEFEVVGMETEFDIPESEILLQFDGKLMERAFANLFENSIRYNKSGTRFTLSITQEKDTVQIVLADDGIGIETTIAETIFEPFVRSDKSRNSNTGGSGLGLSITAKIIQAHRGSIELVTALGKGCRFIVRLRIND